MSCKDKLEVITGIKSQIQTIKMYHEGRTNHRGITETIKRIKEKRYWPNLHIQFEVSLIHVKFVYKVNMK